uniref:Uncharacterized protein n=1 Tax=Amphimedon queenslandica TaxID=400682 RepID=A0A1X7TLP1_AMPQE
MARPLPSFISYDCTTAACSISNQTEEHEDYSSLYFIEPITETAGDLVHKSSLVTGVAACRAKQELERSQLVTGKIEHKILHHRPSTAAQKTLLINEVFVCKKS